MFERLKKFWKKYGFEIALLLSVLCMILIYFFGPKHTQSEYMVFPRQKRRPPGESKGELECRRVLEKIFGKPFPKARPDFLRNPVTSGEQGDNNLELDCYNSELQLAVEYNGVQHYRYVPFFHRNKDAFQNQKYRDHMKREVCKRNGITLIEVPYTVKTPDIEKFLREKLGT